MADLARASRLIMIVAPCVLATVACGGARSASGSGGSATPGPTASASAGPAARCRTGDLTVALGGSGVAAGRWSALVTFTNRGSAPCDLTGYPTVVGVTEAGTTTTAAPVSDLMNGLKVAGSPSVVLPSGGRAGVGVTGASTPASGNSCPSPYQEIRVTPPGQSQALPVAARLDALSGDMPSCDGLRVSAVHPLVDFSFAG
jgi:hypothetical protein